MPGQFAHRSLRRLCYTCNSFRQLPTKWRPSICLKFDASGGTSAALEFRCLLALTKSGVVWKYLARYTTYFLRSVDESCWLPPGIRLIGLPAVHPSVDLSRYAIRCATIATTRESMVIPVSPGFVGRYKSAYQTCHFEKNTRDTHDVLRKIHGVCFPEAPVTHSGCRAFSGVQSLKLPTVDAH